MRKTIFTTVKMPMRTVIAALLCSLLLGGCSETESLAHSQDVDARAAAILQAVPDNPVSKAPFTLGGLADKEPTQEEAWWTISYGEFPVILSDVYMESLVKGFNERILGKSMDETWSDSKEWVMERFLSGESAYDAGPYLDIERAIRFEAVPPNLLLLSDFNQDDLTYLQSGGGKIVAEEIARSALTFVVPEAFPAESITLEQLSGVLSGAITDWTALGSENPISLHYDFSESLMSALEYHVLKGAPLAAEVLEERQEGVLIGNPATISVPVPYTNAPGSLGVFEYSQSVPDGAKLLSVNGAAPSEETIRSGEYPLTIGCYAVYREDETSSAPKHFVEWCRASEGADAIREAGLVPLDTASSSADNGSEYTAYGYQYGLRLDFRLDGLEWISDNEFMLDDEIMVFTDTLGAGTDIQARIEDYSRLRDNEISEWLAISEDEALSKRIGYPVWVAEYTLGYEEDTSVCMDAVVTVENFNGKSYALILHTIRDADLDMNANTDCSARIKELFAAIEVVTV